MVRVACAMFTAAAILAAGTVRAAPAEAPDAGAKLTAHSSGAVLNVDFILNGKKSSLMNQVYAGGTAPPAYNKKTKLATYKKSESYSNGLSLKATGGTVASTAFSAGTTTAGGITANASASIGSANVTVSSAAGPAISFKASSVSSKASFAATKSGGRTPKGSTTIGSMTLSAPLFGITHVSFSGTPSANKILYHNADNSVVLYVNRLVVTKSAGKATGITVNALALHVKSYTAGPYTISGDFDIDTTTAN